MFGGALQNIKILLFSAIAILLSLFSFDIADDEHYISKVMGIIRIKNMSFYGYHGVSQAEKEVGKLFTVDVEMMIDTGKAAASDNLKDTVNYEEIYKIVSDFITKNTFHLTETVAEGIADIIYERYICRWLCVRVRKNTPPFPGHLDYIEIETIRGAI